MKGKVVLVTGSSSGIGFASLQHFSRMGAKVLYNSDRIDYHSFRLTWLHGEGIHGRSRRRPDEGGT
ncbi:hypothetical protein CPB84DRAFT_1767626 [Gymnopilus junonius]|uniref:Uncharacterized protein n=1 Tax=Gymnopilus junonius TaxID=109634 RepID=A0A9P5TRZ9_GYMJU|nr:hypothetical protein CPB84DRAFT_1767626 [Gymnopilus junonius]